MIVKKIDIREFDEFAGKIKRFSQFQYSEFALAATNYNAFYGVYDEAELIAVFRGWKRKITKLEKIPFVSNHEFIVRRSLVAEWEKLDVRAMTTALKHFMKSEHIYLFSFSPAEPFPLREYELFENSNKISGCLINAGFINKIDNDFNKTRSACFEQAVYLKYEDIQQVEKTFKKDTMRKVRKAKKVGVIIEEIKPEEFKSYYNLFDETGNRDDFVVKDMDFYYNLAKGFDKRAHIYISKLDLSTYHNFVLENQPDKTELLASIEEIAEEKVVLGVAICVDSDMQTYYHSGATANIFRETMHNYLLHYTAIVDSYNRDKLFYNFGAINGSLSKDEPNFSLYQFKSRFGQDTLKMLGEFILFENLIAKVLYKISK